MSTVTTSATTEILAAGRALETLVVAHDLPVARADLLPARPMLRDGDPATPMRPTCEIGVGGDPAGFLRWCRVLAAEHVWVDRGLPDSTALFSRAWGRYIGDDTGDVYEVFDFTLRGHLPRLASGDRLPGVAVEWPRLGSGRPGFRARISTDDLATALRGLGLTDEETTA